MNNPPKTHIICMFVMKKRCHAAPTSYKNKDDESEESSSYNYLTTGNGFLIHSL